MPTPTPVWGITKGCNLLWRGWDGEQVVYNTGSGDTHLLDWLSAETLKKLESAPASQHDLELWIVSLSEANSLKDPADYIGNLLKILSSEGLIEPVIL